MDLFGNKERELKLKVDLWVDRYNDIAVRHNKLVNKWDKLVKLINSKGGQQFLDHATIDDQQTSQFTKEDIQSLIRLCHPDKHNNSVAATRMTQLLLKMR